LLDKLDQHRSRDDMAFKTPQKNLAHLAEQMQGENSLRDYDVLVSYNQTELNKTLLERAAEAGTPLTEGLTWSKDTKGKYPAGFSDCPFRVF
jgi:hypothetical protein